MADLTPAKGKLFWLQPDEAALIVALRADPDQERHIVDVRWTDDGNDIEVVVRHPVSERVSGTLFDCPALHDATTTVHEDDLPPGRYRLSDDTVGDLERIP